MVFRFMVRLDAKTFRSSAFLDQPEFYPMPSPPRKYFNRSSVNPSARQILSLHHNAALNPLHATGGFSDEINNDFHQIHLIDILKRSNKVERTRST